MVPMLIGVAAFAARNAMATSLAAIGLIALEGVVFYGFQGDLEAGRRGRAGAARGGGRPDRDLRSAAPRQSDAHARVLGAPARRRNPVVRLMSPLLAITAAHLVVAVVVGLAAGVLAGLFGVGGGILFVPALTLTLGLEQHQAQATSLLAILPTVAVGTWRQARYGNVRWNASLVLGTRRDRRSGRRRLPGRIAVREAFSGGCSAPCSCSPRRSSHGGRGGRAERACGDPAHPLAILGGGGPAALHRVRPADRPLRGGRRLDWPVPAGPRRNRRRAPPSTASRSRSRARSRCSRASTPRRRGQRAPTARSPTRPTARSCRRPRSTGRTSVSGDGATVSAGADLTKVSLFGGEITADAVVARAAADARRAARARPRSRTPRSPT